MTTGFGIVATILGILSQFLFYFKEDQAALLFLALGLILALVSMFTHRLEHKQSQSDSRIMLDALEEVDLVKYNRNKFGRIIGLWRKGFGNVKLPALKVSGTGITVPGTKKDKEQKENK